MAATETTPLTPGREARIEKGEGERLPGRSPFSGPRLALGAALFLVLSAAGLGLLLWVGSTDPRELLAAAKRARGGALLLAAGAGLGALVFGGTRIWLLGREARPGFRWRDGLRTHLYNAFFGGVTPAGTGGGPAQYLVLREAGLTGAESVAVLTATWVGTLVGFCVMGAASALYLILAGELFAIRGVFRGLLVTVVVAAVGGLAFILSPRRLERLLLAGGRAGLSRWRRKAVRAVGRYRRAVLRLVREARVAWLLNALSSWCLFLSKSLAGVAVLAALAIPASAASAVARQLLQFAVIYFSPGPAGSGVAELSALGFMAGLVPVASMGVYTLLWRAVTSYLQIAVGGVCVAADQARRRAAG